MSGTQIDGFQSALWIADLQKVSWLWWLFSCGVSLCHPGEPWSDDLLIEKYLIFLWKGYRQACWSVLDRLKVSLPGIRESCVGLRGKSTVCRRGLLLRNLAKPLSSCGGRLHTGGLGTLSGWLPTGAGVDLNWFWNGKVVILGLFFFFFFGLGKDWPSEGRRQSHLKKKEVRVP